jgi:predicted Fe-Mo cluster-binding NifX family protein
MKIAACSDDGITITRHLGRAPLYVVFTVEEGNIIEKEIRDKRTFKFPNPSKAEVCGPDGCPHPGHESLASIISDCQVLFTGGIGWGAYQAMKDYNIKTIVTDKINIDEVVQCFLENRLVNLMDG